MCILLLIQSKTRMYGFDIMEQLRSYDLEVKEGTLYPLLSRLESDSFLKSSWEIQKNKGHPKKYYSLTKPGHQLISDMQKEFTFLWKIFAALSENKTKGAAL